MIESDSNHLDHVQPSIALARSPMHASSVPSALIQTILQALKGRPLGLTRVELQALAGLDDLSPLAARKLFAGLEAQGLLQITGRTKDRRYLTGAGTPKAQLPTATRAGTAPPPSEGEPYPPLSDEGQRCRRAVNRPLAEREPVSYRRDFLDAYLPNATYYLSQPVRARLALAGGPKEPKHPAGTYARQILQNLLIDLSWASSHMEGNTYSHLDTEKLITQGQIAEGKGLEETQMILNHKAAIEYLVDSAAGLKPEPGTVKNLHALLMDNLMGNPMDEGHLREAPVAIRGTTYLPIAVPQVIAECFLQILQTATAIDDPFEQAFFLLVHLPYLQSFLDGNKRTARLAANIPFICSNCIPITFMDVTPAAFTDGMMAVYETNQVALLRDVFVFAYERSCARYGAIRSSLGEPDPFRLKYRHELKYIVRDVVQSGAHGDQASTTIATFAEASLPQEARERFRAVATTELAGLHDGNFARYQLRPSEFESWQRAAPGALNVQAE
jgi:hypothetical protein